MHRSKPDDVIEECGCCRAKLSLRLPSLLVPASPWLCRRCDAVFVAAPQLREGRPFIAGIRPGCFDDLIWNRGHARHAGNEQLEQEMHRLEVQLPAAVREGPNERRHARHSVAKRIRAIALADDLRIVDRPYHALTVNISTGGIAILQSCAPEHPYVLVDFSESTSALPPVLLKGLRVREVGPAFEVGGEFLSRIDD